MIDEVMLKTLVFISMLNDLAQTTKDGFVPLSIFDGTQKGMIYDDQAVAEEFSSSWSTAYPAVAGILSGLRDGEVSYYDELAFSTGQGKTSFLAKQFSQCCCEKAPQSLPR